MFSFWTSPGTLSYKAHLILERTLDLIQNIFLNILGLFGLCTQPCRMYTVVSRAMIFPLVQDSDFVKIYRKSVALDYLDRRDVSLYTVSEHGAIFVETSPDLDLYRSDTSPFLYTAQNKHAHHVIRVPRDAFLQWSDTRSKQQLPMSDVVFLANTARCGSTLLGQMFENTGKIVTMSEPEALFVLQGNAQLNTPRMLRAVFIAINKSRDHDKYGYVIKTKSQCCGLLPELNQLFPEMKLVFMYRDGLPCVGSCIRAFTKSFGVMNKPYSIEVSERQPMVNFKNCWPQHDHVRVDHVTCWSTFWCWQWACHIRLYLDLVKDGAPIRSLRYEDLVKEPRETFTKLLVYCGFSTDVVNDGLTAMDRDSQRGLPISLSEANNEQTSRHDPFPQYNDPDVKVKCDAICDALCVPRLTDRLVLPNHL